MDPVKAKTHEFKVTIKRRTERAVLVNDGGIADIWLPLSQIDVVDAGDGKHHLVTVPEWLAIEKEMV